MRRRADTAAFEDVIRANEEDLLAFFQRRILNGADAAEAFGELLLTGWRLRRRMPAEPLEARMWLYGVARNVLRSSRRTLARRSAAVERFADEMRALDAMLPGDQAAVELRAAIEALPPDDAELVRLVYWDGLRSHEAAQVLGINPSTARSRLSRIKRSLRALLDEDVATPLR